MLYYGVSEYFSENATYVREAVLCRYALHPLHRSRNKKIDVCIPEERALSRLDEVYGDLVARTLAGQAVNCPFLYARMLLPIVMSEVPLPETKLNGLTLSAAVVPAARRDRDRGGLARDEGGDPVVVCEK